VHLSQSALECPTKVLTSSLTTGTTNYPMAITILFILFVPTLALQAVDNDRSKQQSVAPSLLALEGKLEPMYKALPSNADGLPKAGAVRYMARRYLAAEHGWTVKGLDLFPSLNSPNASEEATLRAAQLLKVPQGLPTEDRDALLAMLSPKLERGFSLREAARLVLAIEQMVSDSDVKLMRKASQVTRALYEGAAPPFLSILENYAAMYLGNVDIEGTSGSGFETSWQTLAKEIDGLKKEFAYDIVRQPLEKVVQVIAKESAKVARSGPARAQQAARLLKSHFQARQEKSCQSFRRALIKRDQRGTGQLPYGPTYGVSMGNWALLETPEYLNAVGALDSKGFDGKGPAVLIPNYFTSVNSCRQPSQRHSLICCIDECETQILSRIEAAVRGPRATPKQIWSAVFSALKSEKAITSSAKKILGQQLRLMAAHYPDGRLGVHGKALAEWLHRAFPHKCSKPTRSAASYVIDPDALSPEAWQKMGKHIAMDEDEVSEIHAHLQRRWGATGDKVEAAPVTANIGLDKELQMISKLHKERQAGERPAQASMQEAFQDAINVRPLEPAGQFVVHAAAFAVASGILSLLLLLRSVIHCCISCALKLCKGIFVVPKRLAQASTKSLVWHLAFVWTIISRCLACIAGMRKHISKANRAFVQVLDIAVSMLQCCARTQITAWSSLCTVSSRRAQKSGKEALQWCKSVCNDSMYRNCTPVRSDNDDSTDAG